MYKRRQPASAGKTAQLIFFDFKETKEMGKEVGNQGEKGNQKKVHKEVPTRRDTHRGARIPIESRDGSA